MKKSTELRQKRAEIRDKGLALINKAKAESRELTEEEEKELDEVEEEEKELDEEIERAEKREQFEARAAGSATPAAQTILTPEQRAAQRFSYTKFIREAADEQRGRGKLTGIEKEMHEQGVAEARTSGLAVQGYSIPAMILSEQRDMTAGTSNQGGFMIPTEKLGFFEALRARLVLARLGAGYMTGLIGNVDLPGFTTGTTAAWAAENGDATETTPVVGGPTPRPKRLASTTDVSRQLMIQTGNSVDAYLINDLLAAIASEIERAAINGSGSSNQPTGLLNASITSLPLGTNGAAITNEDILALEATVESANAEMGSLGYLTNGKVRGVLKNTFANTGSSIPVWQGAGPGSQGWGDVNGYQAGVTNNVPSDLTKGSATGVCSAMLYGNWNDLIICGWGGLDLIIDPFSKATKGMVAVTTNSYWDVAIRRTASFACIKDILTA